MKRVRALVDTFYGDFPAELEFDIIDGKIDGKYYFIGYEGKFNGEMTGSNTFHAGGVLDSYVGPIEFSIAGSYDGEKVRGDGVTAKKGNFTLRGSIIEQ